MKSNKKGLLPTGLYHLTLVEIEPNEESDTLVWLVDSGQFSYQAVKDTYGKTELGNERLKQTSSRINQEFVDRRDLIGSRTKARIDRMQKKGYKVNIIMEYSLPDHPPEFNVMKGKSDDHFFTDTKRQKRKLPI